MMAEEEVQYASVTFKHKKKTNSKPQKEEETVYGEVKEPTQTTQQISASEGCLLEKEAERKQHYCLKLGCLFGILCIVLILGIIGIFFYQTRIKTLNGEQEKLKNETREMIEALMKEIEKLKETQNELNVSRAQWSIDAYCRKDKDIKCEPCQKGWDYFHSSCYAYNDAEENDRKNWSEARENCRGKASDLIVVANKEEKAEIKKRFSPAIKGIKGYWIGLRAIEGKWKWINGTELKNPDWIKHNAAEGQCVTVLTTEDWRSVSCEDKNAWICGKKALNIN